MKQIVIINTKTRIVETEIAFRDRWRSKVSFNGPLTKKTLSGIAPDCIMQEVPDIPVHDNRFQTYHLSDPFDEDGTLKVKWVIKGKPKDQVNQYLNGIVEEWIDARALEKGYSNQDRMISYIGDPNPVVDREARYMKFWRSLVWQVVIPKIERILSTLDSPTFVGATLSGLISDAPSFDVPEDF